MPDQELDVFDCDTAVPAWRLHVAHMAHSRWRDLGNVMDVAMEGAHGELARAFPTGRIEDGATVRLVRAAVNLLGLETAGPLASEALLASFLRDGAVPRGTLAWEVLAVLTIKSQAPWAVLDRAAIRPPLLFRIGEPGETLPGGAPCGGLPVLADQDGAKASPWIAIGPTDLADCERAVFVCFLPHDLFRTIEPKTHMGRVVWLTWAYKFLFERTVTYRSGTR
jgi:hypothetical protein